MRVERAFAFVDLCGLTAFTETHGDAAALAMVNSLRSRLREMSARHGFEVIKWLSGGAMLSGADLDAMLVSVLHARDQTAENGPLALRAGVAWGEAFLHEGPDYTGATVNLSARLCFAATSNRILAPASLVPRVRCGRFAFAAPRELRLKGIGQMSILELSAVGSTDLGNPACPKQDRPKLSQPLAAVGAVLRRGAERFAATAFREAGTAQLPVLGVETDAIREATEPPPSALLPLSHVDHQSRHPRRSGAATGQPSAAAEADKHTSFARQQLVGGGARRRT